MICGLISGAIVSTFMLFSIAYCYQTGTFDGSIVLGYASMILAFSLIFVGVKNFRDKYNKGFITFWQAFKTGLYIALVASTVYVIVWLIDYYLFIPDFMDKYASSVLDQAREAGASEAEMQEKVAEMGTYKEMYKNPLMVVLFTYFEILPVGILVSLICAFILKRPGQKVNAV